MFSVKIFITYILSGIIPIKRKEINVASPILKGVLECFFVFHFCWSSAFDERYAPIDIENPSARRFANQSMRIIRVSKFAHTAHDTTAKVVTDPSTPPYTNSGKYFLNLFIITW